MGLRIYEYPGLSFNTGIPPLPPLGVQTLTPGSSASTGAIGAHTYTVTMETDAGCYVLVTSSGSTVVVTSTNGVRIAANLPPQAFAVSPLSRITTLST